MDRRTLEAQEAIVREHHTDYDAVLAQAGIWQATQIRADGSYVDPVFASLIYGDPNPPARAYQLAHDILAGRHAPPVLAPTPQPPPTIPPDLAHLAVAIVDAIKSVVPASPPPQVGRLRRAWRILIGRA